MQQFIFQIIDKVASFSIREWLLFILTAIIALMGWVIYDLQQSDFILDLVNRNREQQFTIDECLLSVKQDQHMVYRTIYIPEISGIDNYDFIIGFVKPNNEELSQDNAQLLRERFLEQCQILDNSADIIKNNIINDTGE